MSAAANLARAQEAAQQGRRSRVVQHVRLQPACADDAAQMRFAVEDALNTADFGDCGRLVLVRRLQLRAVPPRASPAWMARALEQAWRSAAARAMQAEAAGASGAAAVFFTSRVVARLAWLRRAVWGGDVDAWFWPAALPELKSLTAGGDVADAIATVVEALAHEGWADAQPALQTWPDDRLAALARRLPADTLRRLLSLSTAPAALSTPRVADATLPLDESRRSDSPSMQVALRLATITRLDEPAATWLAALWLAQATGALATATQARVVVVGSRQVPAAGAGLAVTPGAVDAQTTHDRHDDRPRLATIVVACEPMPTGDPAEDGEASHTPSAHPVADAQASSSWRMASGLATPRRPPTARQPGRAGRRRLAGSPWPWLDDAAETSHGGLLVMVNLLQAMRFERWLGEQLPATRQPFVDALFSHVLTTCDASPQDPQFAWFAPSASDMELLSTASLVVADRQFDTAQALRLWRLRLRRVLRRHVGLDLPELVCRDAWVSGTATHLDVVFPLADVDLRLRRRSLDSDPGWVAWFGRIVAFHFVEVEALPPMALGAESGGG